MNVAFLDFDGVLNCTPYLVKLQREQPGIEIGEAADIDPEAVARLNRLVREASAQVVISSSWRHGRTVPKLAELLRARGFEGQVIGRTVDFVPNEDPMSKRHCGDRGDEIQAWIDTAPLYGVEVTSFVILDDSADMAHLADRLVRTSMDTGLLDGHVDRAIALLTAPPPAVVVPSPEMVARFVP